MVDLLSEQALTLSQAAATLPCRRGGRPTHSATLFRWATEGLRGVKLEVVQVGATKCTSREALQRFFAKLAEATQSAKAGESARAGA